MRGMHGVDAQVELQMVSDRFHIDVDPDFSDSSVACPIARVSSLVDLRSVQGNIDSDLAVLGAPRY